MKVGLIGCGRVAHIHMVAYKALDGVDVVAVSDTDMNRAKAFAEPYKIDKVFTDYAKLFELGDLDFVDICTPTSTHESIVSAAAEAGLNVLMEKPMGRNSPECERMIEISRKHKTQLCVCHNQLFYPYVQRLKSMADSEGFNLISFRTSHRENFEWLKAHNLAQPWNVSPEHGGILWEVGTHLAYLQLAFLKDINEVYALGVKSKYSVWDDFAVLLRTGSGRWGVFEISWVAKESEIIYEVIGSEGQRIQTCLPHGYILERMEESAAGLGGVLRNYFSDQARLYKKWSKFFVDQVKKPQFGHMCLIGSFVGSLQKGTVSPVTGEDGRNAIRLLECIEKSLDEKKPVEYSAW
jgi:UDP-N-acetyl-2-amino-2-deoxyglucuronate dehydrogenase